VSPLLVRPAAVTKVIFARISGRAATQSRCNIDFLQVKELEQKFIGEKIVTPVLLHGSHAYMPDSLLTSKYPIFFSSSAADVSEWRNPLIILGGWANELGSALARRSTGNRIIYVVIDAANTIHTIKSMQAAGLLPRWLSALKNNDRYEIVRCFYDAIRPDVFVVNNPEMQLEFAQACPECKVVIAHPPPNQKLELNLFDKFLSANRGLRHVQNGGIGKYINPELQKKLEALSREKKLNLLEPNIEGGYLAENLMMPPAPQIVISWRQPRSIKISEQFEIDITALERDWKPATKYANAVCSGSHYIGAGEKSEAYLAAGDPLAHLVCDIDELFGVLEDLLQFPCEKRRLYAEARRNLMLNSELSSEGWVNSLYELCVEGS